MSTKDPERDLGIRFEAENELADLDRWRNATDAERSQAIVELIEHAERIVESTGIRNDEPARRQPVRPGRAAEGDAA